jgi:hypothetical protein
VISWAAQGETGGHLPPPPSLYVKKGPGPVAILFQIANNIVIYNLYVHFILAVNAVYLKMGVV